MIRQQESSSGSKDQFDKWSFLHYFPYTTVWCDSFECEFFTGFIVYTG